MHLKGAETAADTAASTEEEKKKSSPWKPLLVVAGVSPAELRMLQPARLPLQVKEVVAFKPNPVAAGVSPAL
jgi:hypothetical protein